MSKYNLLDIHEGMGYKEFSNSKEEERLDKHPDKMMIKKVKAMMAKEKAVKEGEAVDLAIEASQEKAGIKTENVIKEEADPIEAEMKMHLKQYNAGNIDGDDLAKAFDEILNGRISPPGERGFNTRYGMEESFKTDGESEDSVDNIDKVASPSAKGRGYGAAVGAERSEDDKEQSDITQTTKPMYTENGHVEDYKDEIKEGAYKDFIGQAKEAYSMSEVEDYMESVNNDMRLNGDESYDDWTVEDYMEDLRNYIDEKMDDVREHFTRFK